MANALNRVLSHSSTQIEENIKKSLKELKDASTKSFMNWLRDNSQIVVDKDDNACDINGCIKLETSGYNMEESNTGDKKTVQFFNNWMTVWNTYAESIEKSDDNREGIFPVFHKFATFYFSPYTIFATIFLTVDMIILHIIMSLVDYNFISFVYAYTQAVILISYYLGARLYKGKVFGKNIFDKPADKRPYHKKLLDVLELLCCRWCKCKSDNRLPVTGGAGGDISLLATNFPDSNSQFGGDVNRIANRRANPFLLNDIRPSEMSRSVSNPARQSTETTGAEHRENQVERRERKARQIDTLRSPTELSYYSTIHNAVDYLKYTLPGDANSIDTDDKLSWRIVGLIWLILGILLAYIILSAYLFHEHCTDPNHKSQLLVWNQDKCIRDVVELTLSCFYLLYPIQGFFLYGGFAVVMIGLLMGSDVAYKLSTSWEGRYTSLRRVRAEDFEAQDSLIPGVHDLFPLVKYDAYERYLYISNIINSIGTNWSPLIAFIIISSVGGMGLVYGVFILTKNDPNITGVSYVIFAIVLFVILAFFSILVAFILYNLSYANQHVDIIYRGIILSAPDDFEVLGERRLWQELLKQIPLTWKIFGFDITYSSLVAYSSSVVAVIPIIIALIYNFTEAPQGASLLPLVALDST